MPEPCFRVHPSIGFARVGNSDQYYLAPETMAAAPGHGDVTGGLPIRSGTESDHIDSGDVRDDNGALRRQAARFRVFRYDPAESDAYPNGGGAEVTIGSSVDGHSVTDIVWTVHLANKKANCYVMEYPSSGLTTFMANYERGLPPLRNPALGDPSSRDRIRRLTIDPGPRAISGRSHGPIEFDRDTVASWCHQAGKVTTRATYPKSFPAFPDMYCPSGPIDSLGRLETDGAGRLVVVGACGRGCAWRRADGTPFPLDRDVDNDGWFDDTADGPVSAVIVFADRPPAAVHGAWVVSTDPAYAPQVPNVVTLWDDIFDTWVRHLGLIPDLFDLERAHDESEQFDGFNRSFGPSFADHIAPIFRSAAMQRWITYMPTYAIEAHDAVGAISAAMPPRSTMLSGLLYIRDPNHPEQVDTGAPLMPLSLGDSGQPFLLPTLTQYFLLSQWDRGRARDAPLAMGPGERLDKASLYNCLGGRFSPGIDMTFVVRDPKLWETGWKKAGAGPFRIKAAPLDYARELAPGEPFLTQGYVPVHDSGRGLEPGDASKFMAVPWHTDYNSCATHPVSPNPTNSSTLYWSWPAQRPVSVYLADEVTGAALPAPRYSVRGPGTESSDPSQQGRFRQRINMLQKWPDIGVVIQGSAIAGGGHDGGHYLEVESRLVPAEREIGPSPWPINADPWPPQPPPPQDPLE